MIVALGLFAGCGPAGQAVSTKLITGQNGARLVIVPVSIDGHGPYNFVLDTGAAKSVIDSALVSHLGLPRGATVNGLTGVAGQTQAVKVRVSHWKMGSVALPSATVLGVNLALDRQSSSLLIGGLLGSDLLSRFKVVTVNYQQPQVWVQ